MAHGRRALAYVLAAKMAGYGTLNKKERNGQVDAHTHTQSVLYTYIMHLLSWVCLQLITQASVSQTFLQCPLW